MPYSRSDRLDQYGLTRRTFVRFSGAAGAVWNAPAIAAETSANHPELREAIARLQYFTPVEEIRTVLDKGKAGVAQLSTEQLRERGLLPETWSLSVGIDAGSGSEIETPVTLNWTGLMTIAEKHAVRFPHVCVCANGADPFHMTLWEGVPLSAIIWLTKPRGSIRRVRYESYHAPDVRPFQASLPLSQVLETAPGQMPVILAYKMNGQLIPPAKGGPARIIVPESYGGKLIKWVRRIALTNDYKSTDSDAELNNDTESPLKTRARFIHVPRGVAAGRPAPLTGYAQVGISGLAKVQYSVRSQTDPWPADDPDLSKADWRDAAILPPGSGLERGLPAGELLGTRTFDPITGKPTSWPMRFTIAHWAALVGPLAPGAYEVACRTIDLNGVPQPMPRPFLRTGVTAIHRVQMMVKASESDTRR